MESAQEQSIDFSSIEKKWQKAWEKENIFAVKESLKKEKYYVLEMYPYPSASFLHMGHVRNFTIGDAFARFKRMNGFNVLYPMGYDSFGLPAETASKKEGIHPRVYTESAIKKIMEYQKAMGNSYDWDRVIASHEPEYYRWNQFFFIKLFERGLAVRKKAPVNWCETCQSVLANEEAEGGKCWRCNSEVIQKDMEQWFLKITKYADRLLVDLDKLDWPERIKVMQRNWIGRSEGTEINFEINGAKWPIFTTRPDTIFGVTFVVVSAEHPKLFELVTKEQKVAVEEFLKKLKSAGDKATELYEKEGVFTGAYAINPMTKEKIPVYAGNFVVASYGSGMVMAVPAHDQRDYEFAVKYKIPIKQVIVPTFITDTGVDAIRPNLPVVERKAVFGIVKHWVEDKYYCLDWTKFNWKTFVIGGVENNETAEEAVIREVKEETGYLDIKSVKKEGFEVFSKFFATHKGVNRAAWQTAFIVELASDKHVEPEAKHVKNHKGQWVAKKDMAKFLNIKCQQYFWSNYLKGGEAFTEEGLLINSDPFNGMESEKAIEEITNTLAKKGLGKKTVNYKIRDWLVSRQRYWGTPIPAVHCEACGVVMVSEKDLPVLLPEKVDFKVSGNPLNSNKEFVNTKCPKCGGNAKRETDTMGGFVDSSWYFLRYCDNKNKTKPFDPKKAKYWMPVDQYIGGAEHAVMHLMYARFFVKALKDMKFVDFDEPFQKLFNQGIVYKDGAKMSKSKGNVVFQTDISNKYGIDTARLFLMFVSSPDKQMEWNDEGVEGAFRIINRFFRIAEKVKDVAPDKKTQSKLNITIRDVTNNVESFDYPKAIIAISNFVDYLLTLDVVPKSAFEETLKLISVFCPHIAEELWHRIGNKSFVSVAKWPKLNEKLIDENFERIEQLVQSLRLDILKIKELAKIEKVSKVKIFVAPEWKWKVIDLVKKACDNKPDFGAAMKAVMADVSLRKYGGEVSGVVKTAVNKLVDISLLERFDEVAVLKEVKSSLEKEFGSIEIIPAQESKEQKAKNAFPGKPALLVE